MVKFHLIVFSLVVIFSIQFVACLEEDEVTVELSVKEEKAVFYEVFETVIESLVSDGLVDRNVTEDKITQVEFYEAYEKAKEKHHPSTVEVSLEDEKQIFYVTLDYVVEMMASSGLIDRDVVYKKIFPGKAKTLAPKFDSMVTQAIENARTEDKDRSDSLKARTKGKDKARNKEKNNTRDEKDDDDNSKARNKRKDNARSDEKDNADNSKGRSNKKDNSGTSKDEKGL